MNEKSLLNSRNQSTHESLNEPIMAVFTDAFTRHLALMYDANMFLN